MEVTKLFEVDVERDGKFWLVHVLEIDRYTQGRNLPETHAMARDLIAIETDLDPEEIELDLVVKIPPAILARIEESQRLRVAAAEAQAKGAAEFRAAVRALVLDEGMTVRDVGSLFGISHQRVHQLVHDGPATPRAVVRERRKADTNSVSGSLSEAGARSAPVRVPGTRESVRLVSA